MTNLFGTGDPTAANGFVPLARGANTPRSGPIGIVSVAVVASASYVGNPMRLVASHRPTPGAFDGTVRALSDFFVLEGTVSGRYGGIVTAGPFPIADLAREHIFLQVPDGPAVSLQVTVGVHRE